jgi:hypothetical protein
MGSLLLAWEPTLLAPGACVAHVDPAAVARTGLGTVMADVGKRFELSGRAAVANRFELAEFDAGEIGEFFETDVPAAELPKEGPTAHIPGMSKAFLTTNAPDLQKAAASKDRKTFDAAFQRAAAACNGCHAASAQGFIQISAVAGRPVPEVDLVAPTEAAH